ncbi:hypothetical protein EVAR_31923_1 [Eumeta japonica]|uniref:Uncharacterized protein n=1 Tax=Eumeta variegata TaxID=151549 RepID=A0A4C1XM15_EUMVA|nr:hypothetical protein EVAR_31923_1 [Eumeta japonica]
MIVSSYPHIQECLRRGIEGSVSAKGGSAGGGSSSAGAPLTRSSGTRRCRCPLIAELSPAHYPPMRVTTVSHDLSQVSYGRAVMHFNSTG